MRDHPLVIYIQYTNPAGYPPLEQSSRLLGDAGWQILFLGTQAHGSADKLVFPAHPRIRTRLIAYCPPGWGQKIHYIKYALWVLACVAWIRPKAVYCSDTTTAPVGLLVHWVSRVNVFYHEHDSPGTANSLLMRVCRAARRRLAAAARLCILPNAERLKRFVAELRPRKCVCVWNCPARRDTSPQRDRSDGAGLVLWYHGSLTPPQFPSTVIRALAQLPPEVTVRFAGYETIGHSGYVRELLDLAEELGVADRVRYLGTPPSRQELYALVRQADVGLVLFDREFREPMAGASNKPFDYLACGLALLVTDTPEWEDLYVTAGCARSCNPHSPEAITAAIRWFLDKPGEARILGEAGLARIQAEWNYEVQFRPVREILDLPPG